MKRSKINLKRGLFIVFASFLWLLPSTARAVNCDTDGPGALQAAINAAGTGATISVSGTCNENVFIGRNCITGRRERQWKICTIVRRLCAISIGRFAIRVCLTLPYTTVIIFSTLRLFLLKGRFVSNA